MYVYICICIYIYIYRERERYTIHVCVPRIVMCVRAVSREPGLEVQHVEVVEAVRAVESAEDVEIPKVEYKKM